MNQKEEDKRRFDEFLRLEEEREQERREKKREGEHRREVDEALKKKAIDLKELEKQKRAERRELLEKIMREAHARHIEGNKKKYDLSQPPNGAVPWLVFDRSTGELLGEATAWRAYEAWDSLNLPQSFPACRCIQREDWEEAERRFLSKKNSNGKAN